MSVQAPFLLLGWTWGILCLAWVTCLGCSGAEPGKGADLWLRVDKGQLVRAAFPSDRGGPKVTFADFRRSSLRPGEARVPLSGRTEGSAFSVRIGLQDDEGYWNVPVAVEDPAVQGELTWAALLDFSPSIDAEAVEILLQAVDEEGRGGPWKTFVVPTESTQPDGALAVRLNWDANADVDLWITDPKGITLSPKNISGALPAEPGPLEPEPSASPPFGFIDIDSNANCRIDGLRQETAHWEDAPPEGTYQISVDLASPCSTERTSFAVSIWIDGQLMTSATGNLFAFDARHTASGSGAPILALTFSLQDGKLRIHP